MEEVKNFDKELFMTEMSDLLDKLAFLAESDLNDVVVQSGTLSLKYDSEIRKTMELILCNLVKANDQRQSSDAVSALLCLKNDSNNKFILWLIDYLYDLVESRKVAEFIKSKSKDELRDCIELLVKKRFIRVYSWKELECWENEFGSDYLNCVYNIADRFIRAIVWERLNLCNCIKRDNLAYYLDDYFHHIYNVIYEYRQELFNVMLIQEINSIKNKISF